MILVRSLFCLGAVGALCCTQLVARGDVASQLHAGTAKVEITPAAGSGIDLLGRKLAPHDPLFARVVVLKNQQTSVAIVSVDLIVFASQRVIDEAKAKWKVDHVLLCATHTHAGQAARGMVIKPPAAPDWTRSSKAPADTLDWPGLSADPWYAQTEDKIIAAVGTAVQQLFPARIVAGKGSFESAYMAHNRRLVTDKGVTMLWANPDRIPTQPLDPTVGVIRIDDLHGKPRALVVHYACHPVTLMGVGAVSRDFPGAMVDHIEQELGPDCMGMFLQGALGDIDPYDINNLRGRNRFNIAQQAGIALAKRALSISSELKVKPADAETTLQVKESLLTIPNRDGKATTDVGLITVVVDGQLALFGIPGEPFIQHQLDLAAASPVANTFVLGLAYNGRGSPYVVYIPTAQAVREGGYGASECSFLAADAGEKMIREGAASLGELVQSAAVTTTKNDEALAVVPFNTKPGPEYQASARLYQGVPGIARDDKSGRLWATWYTGGRGEDKYNYVVVVTSGDDGATWTEPVLVVDPPNNVRTSDSCLWTAPDGRLHFFYTQNDATRHLHDGRWGVWLSICDDPSRADSAWSPPIRICDGLMLQKPTVLRDGAWLLPVANWYDRKHGAGIVRSTDDGRSFQWIGGAPGRNADWTGKTTGGGMEHMIVERKDGTLWMPMRIEGGVCETTSTDGGVTWSPPIRSAIEGPGARFHVRRLRSGRLLMINHVGFSRDVPIYLQRSHLTAMLSDDDGRTWPHRMLLDDRTQVSYPDAVETPEGELRIIYDHGRTSAREILLAKTNEADILAGKPGPATKLRLLINKATGPR